MSFPVHWQGKPLKTPAGNELCVPAQALAEAIEAEWAVVKAAPQRGQIPLTQYSNTAIDHVAPAREGALRGWLSHAETDLLCYRAGEPLPLKQRQEAVWQPLLDWVQDETGAKMAVLAGVMPQPQPTEAIAALRRMAEKLDDFHLMALAQAGGLLGSAVLALALVRGRVDVTGALAAALLDEIFQSEQWGEPEELTRRRDDLTRELTELHRFLCLLREKV